MLSNQRTGDRKKAEKARALLALAAESRAEHGPCLTADEMAVLVDGGYEKKELAIYRSHLSSCEICYGQWVALMKMQGSAGSGSRIFRLSSFKKYRYIGSALAVAASVAVFLNIYIPQHGVDEKSVEEPVVRQQMSETPPGKIRLEKEEIYKEGSGERSLSRTPVATDTAQEKWKEDKAATPPGGREVLQAISKKHAVPAARLNSQAVERVAGIEEVASDEASDGFQSTGSAFADIQSWLETVRENCETGRSEPDFWSNIHLEGEMILTKQSGSLGNKMEEKVKEILQLLSQVNSDSAKEQCQGILALLGKDGPVGGTR